jgi:glucose/arabinose dehydrogenase
MRALPLFAVVALAGPACGGGAADAARVTQPDPTQPGATPPATSQDSLHVPSGFRVSLFARVDGARVLSPGADGALYVSQTYAGRVMRVVDANGDGVADGQTVAVDGLDRPHGLAWRGDRLYIATTRAVVRVRIQDGRAAGAPEQLATYSGGGGHFTRSIVFGADSGMYISIGSSCNVCVEASPDRAAVMRYDPDGRNGRLFASGLRNAVGMAVHPVTGAIWVSQHERDNITPDHQDLPPEEINILVDGGDFGWPYCHSNRVPNPEFRDQARCDRTLPPALMMQAHSAPLGMTFLTGASQFPAEMRGDLLLAFHGSWNRDVPTGATVVRIRVVNNAPVSYADFLWGFQRANGSRWGRPVDVAVWKDGSVLVAEDQAGGVYRISR